VRRGVSRQIIDMLVCTIPCIKGTDVNTNLGPFGDRTKTSILFVSNTLDPVTPITKCAPFPFPFSPFRLLD
jgi:hypothetical protein